MATDDPDFYEPPKAEPLDDWEELPRPPARQPPVWTWYVVYCVVMAMLMGLAVLMGLFLIVVGPNLPRPPEGGNEDVPMQIMGAIYLVIGLVFMVPYILGPMLPKRPWAWVYGIVLICGGMTSCCSLPAAIPLLIYWIKPETKAYFGKY